MRILSVIWTLATTMLTSGVGRYGLGTTRRVGVGLGLCGVRGISFSSMVVRLGEDRGGGVDGESGGC